MQEAVKRRKKAVNLSIDAKLLAEAKEAGINLSETLEHALTSELRHDRWDRWRQENRAAIEAHNEFIREHGLLSDEWRKF
ncbi:type II toxin-antitoxin system CcdA family antitoxin [Hyphomicrobium sulfonivorans]|nr:type II toxin-antitoxin system CcdA family antitoxin [Hyphomicrobium sulfonivorans]